MANFISRCGKRIPIPSTIEIKHAFMAHVALEAHRTRWAAEEGMPATAQWDEIVERRAERLAALERRIPFEA